VAPNAEVRADVDRAKAIASGKVDPTRQDIISLTGLLHRLAGSLERLDTAADSAATGGLHVPLAALSGQLHRGIEAAAKIQGMYAEPSAEGGPRLTVNISMPVGFSRPDPPLPRERDYNIIDVTPTIVDPLLISEPEPPSAQPTTVTITVPGFTDVGGRPLVDKI
jgi:hypothetical protein